MRVQKQDKVFNGFKNGLMKNLYYLDQCLHGTNPAEMAVCVYVSNVPHAVQSASVSNRNKLYRVD